MSAEAIRADCIAQLMNMDDEGQLAAIRDFLGRNPFNGFGSYRNGVRSQICYTDAAGVRYERVLDLRQLNDFQMEGAMNDLDNHEGQMVIGPNEFGDAAFMIKDDLIEVDPALHGESGRSLAREFGVSQDTMWQALTGKTWAHVGR